ncbi:MAG: polysaccharide pyruvyl transferase family protein [Actinomycetia bacterium]|nr:polysaccharide pyruvyl transferase family protein [Actinomycetes bacterium]
MIAVTHAYSRANAGDGLLIDLTLKRLHRAGIDPAEIVVLAMDPASLTDLTNVVGLGTATRAFDRATLRAARNAVGLAFNPVTRRVFPGRPAAVLERADAFVAVGGGYLRAGSYVNAIGTTLNHLPPLLAAARSDAPSVYLPQSVGPLRGPVGEMVRRLLARTSAVHLRDDRSSTELADKNVRRTPDLAVLELAETLSDVPVHEKLHGSPMIVARALPRAQSYPERLRRLASGLGAVTWGVQTEGSADKSDRTFYRDMGFTAGGLVRDVLAGNTGPVISVRLHGALQALLAGVPAIHLGYERKSWGAFQDLGLERFVHSARSFDPARVIEQVIALRRDASGYWSSLTEAAPRLAERSSGLDDSLRALIGTS